MKKYYIILHLLLFTSFNLLAQTSLKEAKPSTLKVSEDRLKRIDNMINQYVENGQISGAVGLILKDGKIIYKKGFGYDDPETKLPLKVDGIFRIASQTKAITSVAVMMLFEEGKFLLDDPISLYLPAFAKPQVLDKYNEKDTTYTTVPAKREITIRDLLTHTSGIDYSVIGSPTMTAIYSREKIPSGIGNHKQILAEEMDRLAKLPLASHPGEKYVYGLNTDVLGYLVEVVSGKSLDKFFEERIFKPLGMNDTFFYLPEIKHSRLVSLISLDKNKKLFKYTNSDLSAYVDFPKAKDGSYFSGGAGLVSTVEDYAIFLQMLLNGGQYNGQRILARRTVDLMTTNQIGNTPFGKNKFGLGFEIFTGEGQAHLGISEGSFAWGGAFGTTYWVDPKEKLVCLLYMQSFGVPTGNVQDKFKALVYQALEN
jgi:CubicO group peptidase (beta-lactamase class C family)